MLISPISASTVTMTGDGMGMRSFRHAMIVEAGVVKYIGVEVSGKFEVSNVKTVLGLL